MKAKLIHTKIWSDKEWKKLIKINLGAGATRIPGFINTDNRTDIVGIDYSGVDVCDMKCFKDNYADYVYASHLIEHLPRTKTMICLKEVNRILNSGGTFRMAVPDFDAVMEFYQKYSDIENIQNWIYGSPNQEVKNEFRHFRIFNFDNLRALLLEAGFKRITRYDERKTNHSKYDDFSFARQPHMSYEEGSIGMSLNVECVK